MMQARRPGRGPFQRRPPRDDRSIQGEIRRSWTLARWTSVVHIDGEAYLVLLRLSPAIVVGGYGLGSGPALEGRARGGGRRIGLFLVGHGEMSTTPSSECRGTVRMYVLYVCVCALVLAECWFSNMCTVRTTVGG